MIYNKIIQFHQFSKEFKDCKVVQIIWICNFENQHYNHTKRIQYSTFKPYITLYLYNIF